MKVVICQQTLLLSLRLIEGRIPVRALRKGKSASKPGCTTLGLLYLSVTMCGSSFRWGGGRKWGWWWRRWWLQKGLDGWGVCAQFKCFKYRKFTAWAYDSKVKGWCCPLVGKCIYIFDPVCVCVLVCMCVFIYRAQQAVRRLPQKKCPTWSSTSSQWSFTALRLLKVSEINDWTQLSIVQYKIK